MGISIALLATPHYGVLELLAGVDPSVTSLVASSSRIRAISQSTHPPPKSTAPVDESSGASLFPWLSEARAVSLSPSRHCAIARTAQPSACAKGSDFCRAFSAHSQASEKRPSRYSESPLQARK